MSNDFLTIPILLVISINQIMNTRLVGSSSKIAYLTHQLNTSITKEAFSFSRGDRFHFNKSTSPDKYYEHSSSMSKRSCSFGIGDRPSLEKIDRTEPARYRITSCFETKESSRGKNKTSFGIGREEYYKGKNQKNTLGPGTYRIPDPIASKPFYIGRKSPLPKPKNQPDSCTYKIADGSLQKLSIHPKNTSNIKLKTDYYPKEALRQHDNHVPGPGSYRQKTAFTQGSYSERRKKIGCFGGSTERMKQPKPGHLGPGSYYRFSEFGQRQ